MPENSTVPTTSGNRSMKIVAIIFVISYVMMAGTVGFLVYRSTKQTDNTLYETDTSARNITEFNESRFAALEEQVMQQLLKIELLESAGATADVTDASRLMQLDAYIDEMNSTLSHFRGSLTYNYRDEIAQAYCASKREKKHVFAVRKDCADHDFPYTCDDLCGPSSVFYGNLTNHLIRGPTECYDGLWFWTSHPRLEPNPGHGQPNAGHINMGTYGFGADACNWPRNHCGPKYCCCSNTI